LTKKQSRSQKTDFRKDMQGMSHAQKLEYIMMSDSERAKYLKSPNIIAQKEKLIEKEKNSIINTERCTYQNNRRRSSMCSCIEYERQTSDAYFT